MANLTGTGIWSSALRYGDVDVAKEAAAELESLGYSAIWLPDVGGDVWTPLDAVLGATTSTTVATGILNIWMHEPAVAAAEFQRLVAAHGPRFLMGLGVSHGSFINATGAGNYSKPLTHMREYLDGLDATPEPVPTTDRVLAALGPKMLDLARTRAAGTHPYLVVPEHTAQARERLGAGPLVAPEQGVVLTTDPARAREVARQHLSIYLTLPNYANNWFRLGFTEEDTLDGGSDRLVDALIVWGDEDAILARVQAHRDAGADHVCLQVLGEDLPLDDWRRLAPVVTG
ncbi:LLM class F420-dependent oxidoreductase [Dermatobacter hominis]|uniref:LLM class F420-dependent oxidoreductase n=1 Tax=Dermatobacter hominis TaxID=2884263 RepID=UPI001D10F327|nr:LLM class F420-dependent oxidoreductase [Dermatobacter hominis]UDY34567.1 LLM class F420-dependent oxidoreductase [Dermatobacter hominis]